MFRRNPEISTRFLNASLSLFELRRCDSSRGRFAFLRKHEILAWKKENEKRKKKKEKTLETLWPRVAALSWLRYHERIVLFPPLGRELGSVLPIRNITPLFRYQPISRLEFLSLDSLFPNRRYFHHILLRLDRFLTNNYARVSNLPTIDTVCFSSFHLSPSILSQH